MMAKEETNKSQSQQQQRESQKSNNSRELVHKSKRMHQFHQLQFVANAYPI